MPARLYQEGDSFLHRLNPVVKLAAFSALILVPTLFLDPALPAAFGIISLLIGWGLGGISPVVLLRRLAPLVSAAVGLVVFNTLFYGGPRSHLLLALGAIRIWAEGLSLGGSIGLRILCIASYSALFVRTTDPTRLAASFIQQAHVPYRLAYAALAAYRFLPILQQELANIRAAHTVRGAYAGRGLNTWLGQVRRYGVPLLANGIRQAERLAIAMDARGFGALPIRTDYIQTSITAADRLFLMGTALMIPMVLIGLARLGLLSGFLAGAAESLSGGSPP
jgi:energy-coupling factor transport system permease protein